MKRDEFVETVTGLVWEYINNEDMLGKNAQIRINPQSLFIDLFSEKEFLEGLADSEEAIEDAAYAEGAETEDAADYQVSQNPDFYPVSTLTMKNAEGKTVPSKEAVESVAANYF